MEDISSLIKQQKLAKAQAEASAAILRLRLVEMQFRPSLNLPVSIRREGGNWVCTLETSEDMLECPIAYGNSPHQAAINFDHLWLGIGHVMEHPADPDADPDEETGGELDIDELDEDFDPSDEQLESEEDLDDGEEW